MGPFTLGIAWNDFWKKNTCIFFPHILSRLEFLSFPNMLRFERIFYVTFESKGMDIYRKFHNKTFFLQKKNWVEWKIQVNQLAWWFHKQQVGKQEIGTNGHQNGQKLFHFYGAKAPKVFFKKGPFLSPGIFLHLF